MKSRTCNFYGLVANKTMKKPADKQGVWTPTKVQILYKHRNGRYYVRTYAGGKEKWTSLRTTPLFVAKNRMRESLDM